MGKGAGTGPQPSVVSLPRSQTEKWATCPSPSPEASPQADELTRLGAKLELGGGGKEELLLGIHGRLLGGLSFWEPAYQLEIPSSPRLSLPRCQVAEIGPVHIPGVCEEQM